MLERERVDERLERGARRAGRRGAVDLSLNRGRAVGNRPNHGEDVAGGVLDDDHRAVGEAGVGGRGDPAAQEALRLGLHRGVQRRPDPRHAGVGRVHEVGEVRSQHRRVETAHGGPDGARAVVLRARDHAVRQHPRQHGVAAAQGGVRRAVGAEARGRLGDAREEGGLREVEVRGRLVEVAPRRGLHAAHVAAVGRVGEVEFEDAVLGQHALGPQRAERLAHLARDGALARGGQAHHLHGEGRRAAHDAPPRGVRQRGPRRREGVHAAVRAETLVLHGDDRLHQPRRHLVQFHRHAPLLVGAEERAQGASVAVEEQAGRLRRLQRSRVERHHAQRDLEGRDGAHRQDDGRGDEGADGARESARRAPRGVCGWRGHRHGPTSANAVARGKCKREVRRNPAAGRRYCVTPCAR